MAGAIRGDFECARARGLGAMSILENRLYRAEEIQALSFCDVLPCWADTFQRIP